MTIQRVDFADARVRAWWSAAYAGGLHTDTPFQSLEWNECWWNAFGATDERRELFLLAAVASNGDIRCVAPLFVQKRAIGGALVWEHLLFIGDDLAPYCDIITRAGDNTDYMEHIIRYCEQRRPRAWLQLHDIPADGHAARNVALPHERTIRPGRSCLRLPLSADSGLTDVDGLLAAARPPFRRTIRKALARAADAASGLDWQYGPADDALRVCLTMLSAERFGDGAFLADQRQAEFFRELQRRLAHEATYAVLSLQGTPVHCLMGFEHGGAYYYFLSGMSASAASLAPGIINFSRLIMHLRMRGLHTIDFLRGEERYKRDFGGSPTRTVHVRIVPPRARARHAAAGILRGMRRMMDGTHRQGRAA